MKKHLTGTAVACVAAILAACGPKVQFTPDDPSDVRQPRNVEDVKMLADGETPGPGYRTLGSVEVTAELTCNTAMTMSKESAKAIIDDYVKSHMDLAEATSQEVVEAMVANGDLSKKQACKVLPIFSQIPEKEEILVAVLKGENLDVLIQGTAEAGGEGLYEVEHEIYKTRKKPALSGAGAVSPSLVVNVKSIGKVISLKEEEPEPEEDEPEPEPEKKVAKKPKKKTEEVVVVKKAEPEEDEEDEEETTVASAKKSETVVVKKTEPEEEDTAKAHADEPWPPPDVFADEEDEEELDPKAAAAKAKKEAEAAMLAVKEAKKQAKLAKLAAEKAEQEKKKAAILKKKAEAKAKLEAEKEAKKQAKLAKKKAAEEEAAKKKAELAAKKKAKKEEEAKKKAEAEAKKKAEAEAKKKTKAEKDKEKIEVEGTELKKADKETIDDAKDIIRGWKKEIFVCLHKSDTVESAGKVALMFFIDVDGRLDALSINPQPESGIKECIMGTVGDLDYPEVGVTYEFSMKYKVKPD